MESLLHVIAGYVACAIQAIAIVAVGCVRAAASIARVTAAARAGEADQRAVWLVYARWLVAALTFQPAADIVRTTGHSRRVPVRGN